MFRLKCLLLAQIFLTSRRTENGVPLRTLEGRILELLRAFERQQTRYKVLWPFLGQNLVGAEIGVYKGGFGEFLLQHCAKLSR